MTDKEVMIYLIDNTKVLDRDTIIMSASSLKVLQSYLKHLTSGVIDDISYEEYNYPCNVIIKQYSVTDEPWTDVVSDFVNIQKVENYIGRIEKMIKSLSK